MSKNKTISIDFDGVVIEYLLGKNWTNQGKCGSHQKSLTYKIGYLTWANINHQWRKPMPNLAENLAKLKDMGYNLTVMTSRHKFVRGVTLRWLKKWKLNNYFSDYYFNDPPVGGAESKVKNANIIKQDIHIDDNLGTILKMAEKYPEMKLYWLCGTATAILPENVTRCESWEEIVKKLENSN